LFHDRGGKQSHLRKEPAVITSVAQSGLVFLGLDVSKYSISVGVLSAESDVVAVDRIFSDEESVRRLISRFPDPGRLQVCYEAGPTGTGWRGY
jgi:hypothetical protein